MVQHEFVLRGGRAEPPIVRESVMRMRLYQAVVVAAVLTASATASRPAASADLYDTYNAPPAYDMAPVPPQDDAPRGRLAGWRHSLADRRARGDRSERRRVAGTDA